MEIIKINDTTWRFENEFVRFFLLEGTEKALLVDTGMTCPDAREAAEQLTDKPIMLLNTHVDGDHISGNAKFDTVYMAEGEIESYRGQNGAGEIAVVKGGDVISLGERDILIIDNPGHTPGSIALLDQKNRVLYSGDAVQDGDIFMFGPGRNLPLYIESLANLQKYEDQFDEIYPSHGTIPVQKDLTGKLLVCAKEIQEGKAVGTPIDMFGNPAMRYAFNCAVILGEAK